SSWWKDQPAHLKLADPQIHVARNLPLHGEPPRLYCPAGVYEVLYEDEAAKNGPRFVINAQNYVHCRTCDIKDPFQNITWAPPEGGAVPTIQTCDAISDRTINMTATYIVDYLRSPFAPANRGALA